MVRERTGNEVELSAVASAQLLCNELLNERFVHARTRGCSYERDKFV